MTRLSRFGLSTLLPLVFLIAACGSGEGEPAPVDLSNPISERDVSNARATLDAGRSLWEDEGSSTYTLEIGVQTISLVQYNVVEGVVTDSEVLLTDNGGRGIDDLPQTVDALFDQVDSMIRELEDDPSKVLPEGECGRHFNIRFDLELGYPSNYDGLGPCDDGVGIAASVIITE
jgi:hypothetical protein